MTKILTILLLFTIVACGQTTTTEESTTKSKKEVAGWETFSGNHYTIQYPPDWNLNTSGQMGTEFILFSPLEDEKDLFKENINLLIQDLTGRNIDMKTFIEISEEQVKTLITNSNLIESTRMKDSNLEYHKMIYSGDQGKYSLMFEQYLCIIDEKAYILTFTCKQETYSEYKKMGEKILNSFFIRE